MSLSPTTTQWLYKAEEARTLADAMHDDVAKRMMLSIAAGYERLAEHASSLAASGVPINTGKIDSLD